MAEPKWRHTQNPVKAPRKPKTPWQHWQKKEEKTEAETIAKTMGPWGYTGPPAHARSEGFKVFIGSIPASVKTEEFIGTIGCRH